MKKIAVNIVLLCMATSGYAVRITNSYTPQPSSIFPGTTIEEAMPFAVPAPEAVSPTATGTEFMNSHRAKINIKSSYQANTDLSISGQGNTTARPLITIRSSQRAVNSNATGVSATIGNATSVSPGYAATDYPLLAQVPSAGTLDLDLSGIRKSPPGPPGPSTGELPSSSPIEDAWLWIAVLTACYAGVLLRRNRRKRTAGNGRTI